MKTPPPNPYRALRAYRLCLLSAIHQYASLARASAGNPHVQRILRAERNAFIHALWLLTTNSRAHRIRLTH